MCQGLCIYLAGDVVPKGNNVTYFKAGAGEKLLGEKIYKRIKSADAFIINLETPLSDEFTPIEKCGPNLIASTEAVHGMKAMHITAAGCANNHILDQGISHMYGTRECLTKAGIDSFGIGDDIEDASKPYIIEKKGFRIGIYACAEHEFTLALDNRPGASPFDALYSFDRVADLKKKCDYVIVMYHGGKEFYRYPSPEIQRVCRHFIEKGADLIVTQHTHCIGCKEIYKSGTIIYGQGNFLFDNQIPKLREYYANGLLLKIDIQDKLTVEEIPVVMDENGCLHEAENDEKDKIINAYYCRSKEIINKDIVHARYKDFAMSMLEGYMRIPMGYVSANIVYRMINKLFGHKITQNLLSKQEKLSELNIIECEAHREIFIYGLKCLLEMKR